MLMAGVAAGAAALLCALARWYLERTSLRPAKGEDKGAVLCPLYNAGAGFGLEWLRGRWLIAASAAAIAVLAEMLRRARHPLARIGIGLALGGGISNLWERVRYGRVFDYIRFPRAPGRTGRLVFNLADFAVLTGVGLLLVGSFRRKRER